MQSDSLTPAQPPPEPGPGPRRAWVRAAIVLVGIIVPQFILYGPSLAGRKVLLPLDLLTLKNYYLPWDEKRPIPGEPSDWIRVDLIMQEEVFRRFAVQQVRSGHLPLWNPYIYCGAPFIAANHTAVFSPYRALGYLWPGPWVLAWEQLLRALVAGTGAYLFFRRELRAAFPAAAVGAWCFPLSGTMVLAVDWGHGATVTWLPWVLLAVGRAVRTPGALSAAAVMVTTGLTQVSGHAATGAHVLLTGGAYATWRLLQGHGVRGVRSGPFWRSAGTLCAGWALGVMLASPQILPTAEYLRTSDRIASRLHGEQETAPLGWAALAQLILPDALGSTEPGSVYLAAPSNKIESAAGGYAGLLVALVAAPLALGARPPHSGRGTAWFWLVLAAVCMVPALGVPVVSRLFEVPPLGMLRNNRLVFVTGFAVTALGVIGLDALLRAAADAQGAFRRRARPMLVVAAAVGFSFAYLAFNPPEAIAAQVPNPNELRGVQAWFSRAYTFGAVLCATAAAAWIAIETGRWRARPVAFVWTLGVLALGEMAATAWGENPHADPSLYYPPVPTLNQLTRSPQSRVWGWYCLPPNLAMVPGLRDVRGYDAVDPARPVRLVQIASDPNFPPSPTHARTQWATPRPGLPLLAAMSVRYLIGRGQPPPSVPDVVYNASDYWVAENRAALPRAYAPRRAEVLNDEAERLRRLGSGDFAPADVVYVESDGPVPPGPFDADVTIARDDPTVVRLDVTARTPAVVVLTDHWYAGWTARLNGAAVPILRANHAFRAVEVPPGKSTVEFRYEPASFRTGVRLAIAAAGAELCWLVAAALWPRRNKRGD